MAEEIARVFISGDSHSSNRDIGAHRNYAKESLWCEKKKLSLAKELKATHWIGTGDFTHGRITALEYREEIDAILEERYELTNGNSYEIKGNHDSATYGHTELEYYYGRKLLKPSENITVGNVNFSMVDYGEHNSTQLRIKEGMINVGIAHGFFKFEDTALPPYGDPVILDYKEDWFGLNFLICGHIHDELRFEGSIRKEVNGQFMGSPLIVHYLPCFERVNYHGENTATHGTVVLIRIYDNGEAKYEPHTVELIPVDEAFNIEKREAQEEHKEMTHVDVSDVADKLDKYERVYGNPEDIIMSKTAIDIRYRMKAVELLKEAEG